MYLYARGFRYDGARQRYLVREYDPDLLPLQIVPIAETWTDYDGDQPYGDFTVNGTVSNLKFHELGIGEVTDPLGVRTRSTRRGRWMNQAWLRHRMCGCTRPSAS